jgi:uncharacterized protein with HEPN domain
MTNVSLRLNDILEAIERLRGLLANVSLEEFENDWQKQWIWHRQRLRLSFERTLSLHGSR